MNIRLFLLFAASFFPFSALSENLSDVSSFAFQLQEMDLSEMADSPFDLIIMDYSSDGSDEEAFSPEQIQSLKESSSPHKKIVSYLSIGEAEDYRYYFKKRWTKRASGKPCEVALSKRAPRWLDNANEDWCGNYKTRFWMKKWKRKIFGVQQGSRESYLDRIIDAGFDGVYLDIIDGFEYWKYDVKKSRRRRSAHNDMARFVIELAEYSRNTRGKANFIIIPQNGAGLIEELDPDLRAEYLDAIDGIGAEDTFYFGDDDENNPLNPQTTTLEYLREFRDNGKVVLSIDYLTEASKIQNFLSTACNEGFIPQVSVRALDSLSAHTTETCDG